MTIRHSIKIPELLRQNIITTFGSRGETWIYQLPSILEKYFAMWDLELFEQIEDLSFNYVVKVYQRSTQCVAVLKTGPHISGLRREKDILGYFGGGGAPKVLAFDQSDGVLLMEYIDRSQTLEHLLAREMISDAQATTWAAQFISGLSQGRELPVPKMTAVEIWGLGFEKFQRENFRGVDFPMEALRKAETLFMQLQSTAKKNVILHGDLHHRNLLVTPEKSIYFIDPKGLLGDPVFEVGAFIRNPLDVLTSADRSTSWLDETLRKRIEIFSEVLGVSQYRVWGWSYAQCVLASIWSIEDQDLKWKKWLQVAEALQRCEPSD